MSDKECVKTCSETYRLSQQTAQTLKQQGSYCDAVVAQNKSLQGELRLYKRMVDKLINKVINKVMDCACCIKINDTCPDDIDCKSIFVDMLKQQALQELEAENGLH